MNHINDDERREKHTRIFFMFLVGLGLTLLMSQCVSEAYASDKKVACVQVGDDAGTTGFVTIPTGNSQVMARCEGYSARHVIGNGSGTVATSTDSILDADNSMDICIDPANDTRISFYKQYDGGNPQCCLYKVKPRTLPCNQP